MSKIFYEIHSYKQPSFPAICHRDTMRPEKTFRPQWHENPELLCVYEGTIQLTVGGEHLELKEGETAVINSDEVHVVSTNVPVARYFCLIVSKKMCEENEVFQPKMRFPHQLNDRRVYEEIKGVFEELETESSYALPKAKFRILLLCAYLAEKYGQIVSDEIGKRGGRKEALVRGLMDYINENYGSAISVQSVCRALGFSESYACHVFRESTGQTLTEYINSKRCTQAQQLLRSGMCNVSEAASQCGFTNLSYFSKVYRDTIGCLPKEDARAGEKEEKSPVENAANREPEEKETQVPVSKPQEAKQPEKTWLFTEMPSECF